ncbi:MAG: porin [Gemmataceae bacterium]
MWTRWLKRLATAAGCQAAFLCVANLASAQDEGPPPMALPLNAPPPAVASPAPSAPAGGNITISRDELRKLIDEAIREHDAKRVPVLPVSRPSGEEQPIQGAAPKASDELSKVVNDIISQREKTKADVDAKKKADGYTVGEGLGMTARWNHGVWIETADKAFKAHVGGRLQYDAVSVWAPANVQTGRGGIGNFDDGVNPRRARLDVEGTFWEFADFYVQYDFVNTYDVRSGTVAASQAPLSAATVENTPAPTDLWITLTHLPYFGNIRIGNQKPTIGFEHLTSSRYLNFMERSLQFDAYLEEGNNGFSPGISAFNTFGEEERATWAVGMFKTTRNIFGWNPGDGELGVTGRLTALPYYADNGRYLVHLGMGMAYKDLDDDVFRFRARTELRNAPAALHNIAAIARAVGDNETLWNPEFVVNYGPWTLQSEYTAALVNGVRNITSTPTQTNVAVSERQYFTQGAYVELLRFLTGEHREYNKKTGSFGRVIPNRNFFTVRDEEGCRITSLGAWQVGARYSWLNLNNNGINGGEIRDLTLGLNWFLNPNLKFQWNYSYGYRTIPNGTSDGDFQGIGMRMAFDF